MRLPIIGLPRCGKTTVFCSLTGIEPAEINGRGAVPRSVPVPDQRVDRLSAIYHPRKTTYASVEYVDLGPEAGLTRESQELGPKFLDAVRRTVALIHVVDAFVCPGDAGVMAEAIEVVDAELALADLDVTERRIERLHKEVKDISGPVAEELRCLEEIRGMLGAGRPIRLVPELANAPNLGTFSFLTAKPILTVLNTPEEQPDFDPLELPESTRAVRSGTGGAFIPICAQIESEIAALPPDEARAFLDDYGITAPARERVIRASYELLGLMSFFTVGEDEVRAWTVRQGASALDAAERIHKDLARGFIAAEVLDYDSVVSLGSFEEARKKGLVRLEGKGYAVQDGDLLSIRHAT